MRLLLVEDHAALRRSLTQGLREAGFAVDASGDGEEGLWYAQGNPYDAIILDRMLPGLDGLELLRRLRARGSVVPVLLLTARDGVGDRVAGLDAGADDYLIKPFAMEELLARLRALLRRGGTSRNPVLRLGELELDPVARQVRLAGTPVPLTAREFALLETLARRPGEVVSREELRQSCYDFAADPASNVIDVYIGYLRRKLGRPGHPAPIRTWRGRGYELQAGP